jgi:hypothetical protein
MCQSTSIFEAASKKFITKWKNKKNCDVNDFIDYFTDEWLRAHPNWYEGFMFNGPYTNNGIESLHGKIKIGNLRQQIMIGDYIEQVKNQLKEWSELRNPEDPNYIAVASIPSIGTAQFTNAYQWLNLNKESGRKTLQVKTDTLTHFFTRESGSQAELNQEQVVIFNRTFESALFVSFDDFKETCFGIWRTTFPNDTGTWTTATCTCHVYFKDRVCKHIIGIASKLKLLRFPNEAKTVPIGKKRAKGRPKKMRPALEHQDSTEDEVEDEIEEESSQNTYNTNVVQCLQQTQASQQQETTQREILVTVQHHGTDRAIDTTQLETSEQPTETYNNKKRRQASTDSTILLSTQLASKKPRLICRESNSQIVFKPSINGIAKKPGKENDIGIKTRSQRRVLN